MTGNIAAGGSVANGGSGDGGSGGGIRADNNTQTTLASDTIIANHVTATGTGSTTGGNLAYYGAAGTSLTLRDTIIAGSTQNGNCFYSPDTGFTDNGHNFEDDASSQCELSSGSPNNDLLVAPRTPVVAGALASNGGPTQTLALVAGSPAIGTGGACLDPSMIGSPALTVDQRGLPRPAVCDIGAFQHQPLGGTGAARVTGMPAVGQALSCTASGFTGDLNPPTYVWLRDGAAISGATASTYVVAGADQGSRVSLRRSGTSTSASARGRSPTARCRSRRSPALTSSVSMA